MKEPQTLFKYVLTDDKLKKYLSKKYFNKYMLAKQRFEAVSTQLAEKIASAVKMWAVEQGATHFAHWFFPLNNAVAEKITAFDPRTTKLTNIKEFSGQELLQTQADASSFLSTKHCCTHKACGYVSWDFSAPIFIKHTSKAKILYIPSFFMGFNGDAIDYKIPLIRSCKQLSKVVTEFLHLMGYKSVKGASSNLGCEQEYFLIEKSKANLRTDLSLVGQTLFGAKPSLNTQTNNNYYKPFNSKLNSFSAQLYNELLSVGIFAKVQHSEVAPKQFEVVPTFDLTHVAAEQNILLMQIITEIADKHGYNAILNEKPFAHVNGSGKHNNWSIATIAGLNLLDYTKVPPLVFLAVFTSVISAIDKHNELLMASVTTLENSFRLGGHEAPPTTFSAYIGSAMQNALNNYVKTGKFCVKHTATNKANIPLTFNVKKDICNRNRTSTFAFTGNKFEFRAVGSNQNVMLANTVLNTIVAAELKTINSQIKRGRKQALEKLIKNNINHHLRIVYNGDCYGTKWQEIAKKRGIKNYQNNPSIYNEICKPQIVKLFSRNKVYNNTELQTLQTALFKNYLSSATNLATTFCQMLTTQIVPALENWLKHVVEQLNTTSKCNINKDYLLSQQNNISNSLEKLINGNKKITTILQEISATNKIEQQCHICYKRLLPLMEKTRKVYDMLEPHIPKEYLPFPTYNSLLLD